MSRSRRIAVAVRAPARPAARLLMLCAAFAPATPAPGESASPVEVHLQGTAVGVAYEIAVSAAGQLSCEFRYSDAHPLFRGAVSAKGQLDEPGLAGIRRAIAAARLGELPVEFGAGADAGRGFERVLGVTEWGTTHRVRDRYAPGQVPGAPDRASDPMWIRFNSLYEYLMELCPATPMPAYLRYD